MHRRHSCRRHQHLHQQEQHEHQRSDVPEPPAQTLSRHLVAAGAAPMAVPNLVKATADEARKAKPGKQQVDNVVTKRPLPALNSAAIPTGPVPVQNAATSDKGPYLSRHKDRQITGPSSTRFPSPLPLKPMTAKDSKSAATAAKQVERGNVATPKEARPRIADGTAALKDGIAKRIIVANMPAAKTAHKTGEDGVKTLKEAASSKPQIASGATAIKEGIASPKIFVATPAALTVNAGERPLTTCANAASDRLGAALENQRKPSVLPKPKVKSPTSAPKEPHASPAGAISKATATADIPTRVGHLINNLLQRAVGKWEVPERLPEKKSGLPTILEAQRSPLRQEARGAQPTSLVVKADDTSQKNVGLSKQVPVSEKAAGTAKPSNTAQEVALPTLAKTGPHNDEGSPRPMEHKEAEAELFKKGLRDKPSITDNQGVVDKKLPQSVVIKPVKTAHEGNIRKPDNKSSPSEKQRINLKELKLRKPTETKTARKSTVAGGVKKKKKMKGLMHSETETDSSEQTEVLEEGVHKAEKVAPKKALPQVKQVVLHLKQPSSKKAAYAAVNLVEATQAVGETKFAPEKSQKPTHHHEEKLSTPKNARVGKDTTRPAKSAHGHRASKESKQQRQGSDIPTVTDVSANLTVTMSNSPLTPTSAPRKVAKRKASDETRHMMSGSTAGTSLSGTTAVPTSRAPSTVSDPSRTTKGTTAATSSANRTRGGSIYARSSSSSINSSSEVLRMMGTRNLPQPPPEDASFTKRRMLGTLMATTALVLILTMACLAIAIIAKHAGIEWNEDDANTDAYENATSAEAEARLLLKDWRMKNIDFLMAADSRQNWSYVRQ